MKLEAVGKYFAPKSPMLSDSPRATAGDCLDISGVMAALGIANAQCGLGIELYLAKIGVSSAGRAIDGLVEIAERLAGRCRQLSELEDDTKRRVLQILATFAYEDYARSAASVRSCENCGGSGFIDAEVFTTKTAMPRKLPEGWEQAKADRKLIPSNFELRRDKREVVSVMCHECKGKGVISNSCRCHGKGQVIDKDETERQGGIPVWKECSRCSGRGYSRLRFSVVLTGIRTAWNVQKNVGYEQVQPIFDALVTECHKQEATADNALARATR